MLDSEQLAICDALTEPVIPRIQEAVFVRDYLPMFVADPSKVKGIISVNVWINVAGSPFTPVDVYRGTELLYRVPPLLDNDDRMLENVGQNGSVFETLSEATLRYNVMPKLGEAHIRQFLTERVGGKPLSSETIEQWNKIFSHYKLPLIEVAAKTTPGQPGGSGKGPIQFQDYEPI